MKKTLIALAAVAVSSAAMAQVTVSGKLQFDNRSDTTKAGVKTSGNAMNGGDVRFSFAEDIGNGLKASGFAEFTMRGRTATTGTGRDAAMTLSGGFGSITAGAVEAGNGIMGLGNAGAPVIGLDNGSVLDGGTNVDIITYTFPALVPNLGLSVSTMDLTGGNSQNGSITQVAATYKVGGLSLAADHADYKKFADGAATTGLKVKTDGTTATFAAGATIAAGEVVLRAASAQSYGVDSRTRISVGYDLGVAKVGYGYQTKSYNTAGQADNVQTTMGVSIPMGALTIGAVASSNKTDGATTKNSGTEYGASYALSKRTSVAVAAQSWKKTGEASTKATRVRLSHSF